ncbi:MAG: SUF system NifU family Fe-S cluster assembly protein [Gemmatimonadota bacterium]|nr:SUF system NifU family Fe-S cluster assembly protein [Gemmatimonadota bacterium]
MTGPEALYQELIFQHYRNSRHRGELEAADVEVTTHNPVCGDKITLRLRVRDGVVEAARFSGQGCAISQASASMMAQRLEGKNFEQIHILSRHFTGLLHGDPEAATNPALGDLRALSGVAKLPARVRCALLAWDALTEAETTLRNRDQHP